MVSSRFVINCGCWYFEFILKLTLFKSDKLMLKCRNRRIKVVALNHHFQDKIDLFFQRDDSIRDESIWTVNHRYLSLWCLEFCAISLISCQSKFSDSLCSNITQLRNNSNITVCFKQIKCYKKVQMYSYITLLQNIMQQATDPIQGQ